MKCPVCGAATDVLETRPYLSVFTRRARVCFNGHKTSTYEVPRGVLDRRQLATVVRGVKQRGQAERRKLAVLRAPTESATALAARLGITEARVRQIRKEASAA